MALDVSTSEDTVILKAGQSAIDTTLDTSVLDELMNIALDLARKHRDSSPADAIFAAIKHGPEVCMKVLPTAIQQLRKFEHPTPSAVHISSPAEAPTEEAVERKLDLLMGDIGAEILAEHAERDGKPIDVFIQDLRARLRKGLLLQM